ncbi:hypothetical protein WG899_15770 [Paucibacter sp. AS339]|uniref:hypothetical protein n=1 Tax=Paucibacter hankyongi TaxID=3133434 RepID=UPI0030B0AF97
MAEAGKIINVNPITDLTVAKALKAQPETAFAAFGAGVKTISSAQLSDAAQYVESILQNMSGYKITPFTDFKTPDPFTFSFDAQSERGLVLSGLHATMKIANVSYDLLRSTTVEFADYRESFTNLMFVRLIIDRVIPEPGQPVCNLPVMNKDSLVCTIKGKNLSRPRFEPLFVAEIYSDVGISVSRSSLRKPKLDVTKPYQPAWCGIDPMAIGGATFRSTDTNGPGSPDPQGLFAEEMTFTCPVVTFGDSLLVEVVKRNGSKAGPAGWDLFNVGATNVMPQVRANLSFNAGSPSCVSVRWTSSGLVTNGPGLFITGNADLPTASALHFLVSTRDVTDQELMNVLLGDPANMNTVDKILSLGPAACAGGFMSCIGFPSVNESFVLNPNKDPDQWTVLYSGWQELGLNKGKNVSLQVHGVIHDLNTVLKRSTTTVTCPPVF